MTKYISPSILFLLFVTSAALSEDDQRRIGTAPLELTQAESQSIGRLLCGTGHYRTDKRGINCSLCPEFTSNAGESEELTLNEAMRSRPDDDGVELVLFDTDGCEPHFQEFGGALLLQRNAVPAGQPWVMQLYSPGFRLNDCIILPRRGKSELLVCNEESLAQGEIVGGISLIQVSSDDITRWRLLRWYDNSGAESQEIMRIVPVAAKVIEDRKAGTILQLDMELTETTRAHYETSPDKVDERVTLRFERAGNRLFPEPASKQVLMRLEKKLAKFLDE